MKRRGVVVVIVAGMGALIGSPAAWAYNRGTHQHITELGYAYLKLVSTHCVPALISTTQAYDACINGCLEGGVGITATPATLSPETTACLSGCFLQNHRFADPACDALAPVFARGTINSAGAGQAAAFYRNFSAAPCPPQDAEGGGTRYHYYGVEHCQRTPGSSVPGTDFTTALPRPLVSWTEGALAYERIPANYRPVDGGLLGATSSVDGEARADYTGTILGFHAGLVDKLADLYTAVQIFPVINDAIKAAAEITAGASVGVFGVGALFWGALACGISCPVTAFFGSCDDCFEGVWDFTEDVFEAAGDTVSTIQEFNLLPVANGPTTFDKDNTSLFHFMTIGPFNQRYDDQDGLNFPNARGGSDEFFVRAHDTLLWDAVADVQVQYPASRRALMNYQIVDPDDAMQATDERGVFYWHLYGFGDYVFPPVDNLGYYWWHKWLEGRVEGAVETRYGLMPLGGALHAVQDITQPQHARDDLTGAHAEYEERIQTRFDPSTARAGLDGPLLIDLTNDQQQAVFLERVGRFMIEIQDVVLRPNGGVLEMRPLMHYLWSRTSLAPADDTVAAELALPLAVAATTWILMEGSRQDLAPYVARMRLSLAEFERKGPVPPIDSEDAAGSDPPPPGPDIPAGYDAAHPRWVCAVSAPTSVAAAEGYVRGTVNGRQLLTTVMSERTRCDLQSLGLPVPPQADLDRLAGNKVGRTQALSRFLGHGSTSQFRREVACNSVANAAGFLSAPDLAREAARCAGTLDSDEDGVPDGVDQCFTPPEVRALVPVAANGCAFAHEDVPRTRIDPFVAGTIRQRRAP